VIFDLILNLLKFRLQLSRANHNIRVYTGLRRQQGPFYYSKWRHGYVTVGFSIGLRHDQSNMPWTNWHRAFYGVIVSSLKLLTQTVCASRSEIELNRRNVCANFARGKSVGANKCGSGKCRSDNA